MWGNLGAAASPVALQLIRQEFGWDAAFGVCAVCFVGAAATGLSLNALIPVAKPDPPLDHEAADYQEP
jgi:MFS transporter, ACS family, glucarate transporter